MRHLTLIAELLDFSRNKLQHLVQQIALIHFAASAEIDQLAVESVTARAPSVFVEQTLRIAAKSDIVPAHFLQFGDNRLHKRGQRDGVVHARLCIANAELDSIEKRMQPD